MNAVERGRMWAANGWPMARKDDMTTQEPEHDSPLAEASIFALNPAGFKVHIKLPSRAATIVRNVDVLLAALAEKGYTPDKTMGQPQEPAVQAPAGGAAQWVTNPDGTRACSVHGPAEYKAPGVSARTGKPYTGFWKCTNRDCKPEGAN